MRLGGARAGSEATHRPDAWMTKTKQDPSASPNRVRVLVADDSSVVRDVLTAILESDPEITVIGTATDGDEAVALTAKLKPDLVTMDLKMPRMDGMEATERIMAFHPTPILIVSSYVDREGMYSHLDALAAGALDVVEKPTEVTDAAWQPLARTLIDEVKVLSRVPVITHLQGRTKQRARRRPVVAGVEAVEVAGIGVSTGGPSVLKQILSALPPEFAVATLIVQHITEGFMKGLLEWLQPVCQVPLRIAADGEAVRAGEIVFAPEAAHLLVSSDRRLHLSDAAPINGHRPSADVLLKSLAAVYGRRAAGMVLTGMGTDGAVGLRDIRQAGGLTIAQTEDTCVVFGMPRAAIELGAAEHALSPAEIAESLLALHRQRVALKP